jgi:hypothetical protein
MALASVAVVAAGALIIELRQAPPAFPAPDAPAIAADALPPAIAAAPPVVSALETRPLFAASRRPPPIAAAPAPLPVAPPPPPPSPPPLPEASTGLTLVGIIDGPNGRIAMIRIKGSGEVARAVEGDAVDRWQLQQISPDRVTLAIAGVSQELDFPAPTGSHAKAAAGRPAGLAPFPPRPPAHHS